MITTLTPEQIQRGKEFLKDLRANPVKATGTMRDPETGGRCCMCVAYDTAQRLGADLSSLDDVYGLPPDEISSFYGWHDNNPIINGDKAAVWNDGVRVDEKSHIEIAAMFEQEFPQLKEV